VKGTQPDLLVGNASDFRHSLKILRRKSPTGCAEITTEGFNINYIYKFIVNIYSKKKRV
jgi:hypothetical protein